MFIMKEQRLLSWHNWYKNTVVCHRKHYLFCFQSSVSLLHFFACIFIKTKMAVELWCSSLWLQFIKNKDQYSRPFSQARNAGNKVATFHPGHNVALKNLSYLWKTVLFKLKTALALKWDEVSIPCQRNLEKNRFLLFSMRSFLRNKALLELS